MMAKVFTLQGLVRSAEIQRKRADNEVWGTRITVLSEPKGDTVDVTAFARAIEPARAAALEGKFVTLLVDVGVRSGSGGGAFMNVSLIEVVHVADKPPASAAVPA